MKIQMLGTGSAFAKKYYNNNALMSVENFTLLVDCGITAPASLYELGISLDQIHGVLITHIHADHVGGLEEFALRMKFQHERKPTLFIPETLVQTLWENTLKGGLMQENLRTIDDFFHIVPLKEHEPLTLASGLLVEIIRTPHIPNKPSYSLFFNNHFFYSADMRFNPELLKQLVEERGCDTIFHDCQLTCPGAVHACLDELLTLPTSLQERIWLMHYADEVDNYYGKTGSMRFVQQHHVYEI